MESTPTTIPAPLAQTSAQARLLAWVQQLKDTATIVLMNLMLLVPIAWPGLVLYFLRWRLCREGANRRTAVVLWSLTLVHEVLCVALFVSSKHDPDMSGMLPFEYGYILGTICSVAALVSLALPQHMAESAASNSI